MKMNLVVSILCALLLGYLCASFLLDSRGNTDSVFQESETVYFLRYEPEDGNIDHFSSAYLDIPQEDKHYYYVGISTSEENVEKIRTAYDKQGILLTVEEKKVNNSQFVNELTQYDILLKSTKTSEEMNSVLSTILASYEEFVLNP